MQGDAVLDGFSMCILIMQVPGPGGPNGGVELVFHALPELLGRFRSECQEVRHLATATEPARLQLAAETQIKRGELPARASRARGSETLQDDLRDDMLVLDPPVGLGLQLTDTLQVDLAGVRWRDLPVGHARSVMSAAHLIERL